MRVDTNIPYKDSLTRVPLATGIQPVSEGWIGLDAEARRADTPIRQVIQSVSEKYANYKLYSSLRPLVRLASSREPRKLQRIVRIEN